MFERFTEKARQVIIFAQDDARALRHNYIGTEHILLGLLREQEGVAARVLDVLGITAEEVRTQVDRLVGRGDEAATGQIPFTPRAKHALEHALREAIALGHQYIGTEHLLLGLARESDGVAARILLDLGGDAETIRHEIIGVLAGPSSGHQAALRSPPARTRRTARGVRAARSGVDPPRLSRGARSALVFAQEEARALNHGQLCPEHILLGLLRQERGLGARLLNALEITLDDVRAQVIRIAGQGEQAPTGHIHFTPQAKETLERARREALSLDHDSVGTEHILLSLMLQDDGVAARILRDYRR
jgi:ATP-dependent Clp protease ATP-binding subunit ClpA